MKKMLSIIATTTAILTLTTSCGRITSMTKVELIDPLPYKNYTDSEKIVEGNQTAHETISKMLKREIRIDEDCPEGSSVENCTVSTDDQEQYTCYTVEDYNEKDIILFLFKDDTEGVVATESKTSFIHDDDFIDMSWKDAENHKDNNYCGGYAFAYHKGDSSKAIISSSVGTCTSIWGYNPDSSEAHLIWCDYINCPIWRNFV